MGNLFSDHFIDSKRYFTYCFKRIPCITTVNKLAGEKVHEYIVSEYADAIINIHQNTGYSWSKKRMQLTTTIVVLRENCIIELGNKYCEILYLREDTGIMIQLIKELTKFKAKEKKKNFEINLVAKDSYGLDIKAMEIKKTRLDLRLYYEDDFIDKDKIIVERLNKQRDKGIVLLYGLPGTGKTTYLRYLIGRLKKKVLFLSPSMTDHFMDPEFIDLLIDNPNSVVIIEDAENVLIDRKIARNSSVSNLLNISDGLLADFLNVQVICTFNQPLSLIDSALLRKGRLIAMHEFGKLSIAKAQQLSDHLGFDTVVKRPMTVAEISCQNEKIEQVRRVEIIGFRRSAIEN
jgi:hypothetical protein